MIKYKLPYTRFYHVSDHKSDIYLYIKLSIKQLMGNSNIGFCMQCVIMTLASEVRGLAITNDVLKFRKLIEFESLYIVICFSYIYLILDGQRSFVS